MDTNQHMTIANDLPPVPKCFSHLALVNGVDNASFSSDNDSFSQSLKSCNCESSSNTNDLSIDLSPRATKIDKSGNQSYLTKSTISKGSDSNVELDNYYCPADNAQSQSIFFEQYNKQPIEKDAEHKHPFLKLNISLMRLQKEMKDLRYLDVSLFCQLMSLRDSIQDLKLTMSDRYSDTGSEFSLGTASYMGSMSSLNEESDWGEDGPTEVFDQNREMDFDGENEGSDLLRQITNLALKVEEDF